MTNKDLIELTRQAMLQALFNGGFFLMIMVPLHAQWDSQLFHDFKENRMNLFYCWPIIAFIALLLLLPFLPRPHEFIKGQATSPTIQEARWMKFGTALHDYAYAAAILLYCSYVLSSADTGDVVCPFVAFSMFTFMILVVPIVEVITCRCFWHKYISRDKLNFWPMEHRYTIGSVFKILALVHFPVIMSLTFSGAAEFESLTSGGVSVWGRIWLESIVATFLVDITGMHFFHGWMHHWKGYYFLHKEHHTSTANLNAFGAYIFDFADLIFEFGLGVPLLLGLKYMLGFTPKVHILTYIFQALMGIHIHSMNPYKLYFFNPVLDFFGRATVCHNLHHAAQTDYILAMPFEELLDFSGSVRGKNIKLYNKYMKTGFPPTV